MLTGLLIALLVIGTATVAGAGMLYAAQKRQGQLPKGDGGDTPLLTDGRGNLLTRTIYELRVGDVVQYDGTDFIVEGALEYDEDGRKWRIGRLVDGDDVRWLVTGLGSQTSLRLMRNEDEVEVSGYPPETLHADDVRFTLDKRGTATAHFRGDLGNMPGKRGQTRPDTVDRCRWWRYESPGDDTLLVEQWGGEYRVLRGEHVTDGVIEMIPGS
jgi:hypothetical protein